MKKIVDICFFNQPAKILAKNLIGKWLVRKFNGEKIFAQITEVEAYCGINDSACHSYLGKKTERTKVMWETGGTIYVYLCYGIHEMFNIVCGGENPEAVLIRGITDFQGPGKMTKRLHIDRSLNGKNLIDCDEISLFDDENIYKCKETPRIGIDYALKKDRKAKLRFVMVKDE